MAVIRAEGLTKHYAPRRALRRGAAPVRALEALDVEVREGEIFGFLGPNGAGKSTTIRLLLGFLHPSRGRAEVLGFDAASESREIRRQTGYLPGGIALYDTMSGADVLDHLGRLYGRATPRRAALLERLELSAATLRRPVRDYSRGMRQKIGIVQALQHDPALAILDEPSEGLDPLMQHAFYEILEDLHRDGRTIFFSSHVLSEVERVCDRVAIIRGGRLVALEQVSTLLARRKRHVEMRLSGPAPTLGGVPGVTNVSARDGFLTCDLDGDVRPFLAAIAGAPVLDLTIEPARLEEAFLEFYSADSGPTEVDAAAATAPSGRPRSPVTDGAR